MSDISLWVAGLAYNNEDVIKMLQRMKNQGKQFVIIKVKLFLVTSVIPELYF